MCCSNRYFGYFRASHVVPTRREIHSPPHPRSRQRFPSRIRKERRVGRATFPGVRNLAKRIRHYESRKRDPGPLRKSACVRFLRGPVSGFRRPCDGAETRSPVPRYPETELMVAGRARRTEREREGETRTGALILFCSVRFGRAEHARTDGSKAGRERFGLERESRQASE